MGIFLGGILLFLILSLVPDLKSNEGFLSFYGDIFSLRS